MDRLLPGTLRGIADRPANHLTALCNSAITEPDISRTRCLDLTVSRSLVS